MKKINKYGFIFSFALCVIAPYAYAENITSDLGQKPSACQSVPAAESEYNKDTVFLRADTMNYNQKSKTYQLTGHVEMVYQGKILKADMVTYNTDTKKAFASGHIQLHDIATQTDIYAEKLELSTDLSFGMADMLYARRGQYLKIAAEKVIRPNPDITEFYNVVYTPCTFKNDENPLWQIRANKVTDDTRTLDVTYQDASFEVLGQPIISVPEFTYPRPTVKRRTGLLAPDVQFDTDHGLGVKTPYFFELAKDKTLTFSPTFYSDNVPMIENLYKQRTDKGIYKFDTAFTFADKNNPSSSLDNSNDFRGSILSSGRTEIDKNATWGFDFNRVSDDTFFNRFNLPEYNFLQNRLFYENNNNATSFYAAGYQFQDLDSQFADDTVPVVLPYIDLKHDFKVKPFGGQLSYNSNVMAVSRSEGIDTQRFINQLHWQDDYALPKGLIFTFENQLRADAYHTTGGLDPNDNNTIINKGYTVRALPLTAGKIALPLIKHQNELIHLIEPAVQGVLSPYNNQADSIPNEDGYASEFDSEGLFDLQRFYGYDLIEDGPRLNAGIRYLVQKPNIGNIESQFGQSFRSKSDDRFPAYSGLGNKNSDYVGRFAANYKDYIHLTHRYRFDNLSNGLNMSDMNMMVGTADYKAQIGYFHLDNYENSSIFNNAEQMNIGTRASLSPRWHILGGYRQNIQTKKTLETRGALLYTDECFISEFSVGREFLRYKDIEPETTFRLRVKLVSLGNNAFIED